MKLRDNKKLIIIIIIEIIFSISVFNKSSSISTIRKVNINFNNEFLINSKITKRIHIINNSGWIDFRNAGNCTGSGTYTDPYVIEDLVIDGECLESCIWIENSNVYFKIENCTVYNSSLEILNENAGIRLSNVNNSQLIDNFCLLNKNGIFLEYSNNISILENNVNNNDDYGIGLIHSDKNRILGNMVTNNWCGIDFGICDHNTIFENNITNNINGMSLHKCIFNNITGNTLYNNSALFGICLGGCNSSTLLRNIVINSGIGIPLLECYNIEILENTVINNLYGINVEWCNNIIISENTVNNNDDKGIYLSHSNNNILSKNNVNKNGYGLYLLLSHNNSIVGNNLIGNNICISEIDCEGNVFENNKCEQNLIFPFEWIILIAAFSGVTIISLTILLLYKRNKKKF
ncbi:MAG: nitrous oxide reductase family maturation protein NosD [Candidatus Thorarchaeota archaeon]